MTPIHPARQVPFADLFAALEAGVRSGAIARTRSANLTLYIYSNRCVYDDMWDEISVLARGIVLDEAAQIVRATPFPKFFNYGERGIVAPPEPFEVYEKLDGSLVILFHDGGRWRVATKGSFDSQQAQWASEWLAPRNLSALTPGTTYLFEAIYPENRIVVRYQDSGLILLGGYDETGHELGRLALAGVAAALDTRLVAMQSGQSLQEVIAEAAGLDRNREGFVIRFASGLRLKLKGAAYRRIHAMLSDTTPLGLWRAMEAGDDLDAFRREIPEEFWADFDTIRSILSMQMDQIIRQVETEFIARAGQSDRELGLDQDALGPTVRPFLFARRKRGVAWVEDAGLRRTLFRIFRPDGNVLPGYQPSTFLLGARDVG